MAFLLNGENLDETLRLLDYREKNGYQRIYADLQLANGQIVAGITYIAALDNPAFLGNAPLAEMAHQIASCSGPSGANRDYLIELANALRVLNIKDEHVFALEAAVNLAVE